MGNFAGRKIVCFSKKAAAGAPIGATFGPIHDQRMLDTKDFGRVILGGGYAGISSPKKQPLTRRD